MSTHHFNIHRKRAAVEVYKAAKDYRSQTCRNSIDPISIASVAAGGASRSRIFAWLKEDLSGEAQASKDEARGASLSLSEDQQMLLLGFATSTRSSLEGINLTKLERFCQNHLNEIPSQSTLSHIMSENGFSSQQAMTMSSRMTTEEVVDDSLSALEEIRSYNFPPHRIICMDETGLWSNVTQPRTYPFKHW